MITLKEAVNLMRPVLEASPIKKVTVFGSYARGDAGHGSDIDLVVDSGGKLDGISFFVYADKIAKTLPIKSDSFELLEIKKPSSLHSRILNEGVVIYERP